MTTVVIEGLVDRASLLAALSVVLDTMNRNGAFEVESHTFTPDLTAPGPEGERPHDRPIGYVPCPRRGAHLTLTECWMCWSDVMRGAALEPQVLTAGAWKERLPHERA